MKAKLLKDIKEFGYNSGNIIDVGLHVSDTIGGYKYFTLKKDDKNWKYLLMEEEVEILSIDTNEETN